MYARGKLHQCFGCEHRFECWGLLENIPLGKNEKTQGISLFRLLKYLFKLRKGYGRLTACELYGILSYTLLSEIGNTKPSRRDTYQCVFMLAALSNSCNDGWECPGDSDVEEGFIYTPDRPE